jgi:hypothetical protein
LPLLRYDVRRHDADLRHDHVRWLRYARRRLRCPDHGQGRRRFDRRDLHDHGGGNVTPARRGGSGYTNGTGYALGITGGGGSGATGTFDVVGGGITNLQLTAGGSGYTSIPTISFPGAGGGVGANATATVQGKCCVTLTNSGTYTVTADIPGVGTLTATVTAPCDVDTPVSFTPPANSIGTACFTATECDSSGSINVSGATVAITGAGTASGTTDAAGQKCFRLGAGNYSATVTYPDGYTKTKPFTVTACATTTVTFAAVKAMCISVVRATNGCAITYTLSGAASGTCSVTVGVSGTAQCCITFSPIDIGATVSVAIATNGPTWNGASSGGTAIACYSSTVPFVFDFGNAC